MRARLFALVRTAGKRALNLWWVWIIALAKEVLWDRLVQPINAWIDKSALPLIPQLLRALLELITAIPGLAVIVVVVIGLLVLSYWETRPTRLPQRPGPLAHVSEAGSGTEAISVHREPAVLPDSIIAIPPPSSPVTLVPSTGNGPDGVPDARIMIRTAAIGGRFSVRARIISHVNDPNFVPDSDYTLPWADAIGESIEIRAYDERSVRVARVFDKWRTDGMVYLQLLAVTNSYMGGPQVHHETRWDPREATKETLPSYELEIRVYQDEGPAQPKIERFFAFPASQRGPARVSHDEP